jgi:hypothetical protein
MNNRVAHDLGESAGVNRFEDKSLAGTVRIVPPTPRGRAHEPSVEARAGEEAPPSRAER